MLNLDYPINYGQYKQGLLKTQHFSCGEAKSMVNAARVDKSGGGARVTLTPVTGWGGGRRSRGREATPLEPWEVGSLAVLNESYVIVARKTGIGMHIEFLLLCCLHRP